MPELTVREAATLLDVSVDALRRRIRKGEMPARRVGGRVLVELPDDVATSSGALDQTRRELADARQALDVARERIAELETARAVAEAERDHARTLLASVEADRDWLRQLSAALTARVPQLPERADGGRAWWRFWQRPG